ncbi:MAG: DUF1559 domain-containing protein [Isosphaeraceae bacterium]
MFDYRTAQTTKIADIIDGTSNTVCVGEMLPFQAADSNFYMFNGSSAGTTIPPNWNTAGTPLTFPGCAIAFGSNVWNCRFSYASKGFKSKHPGGVNLLFCDGSVRFVKNTISRPIYAAIGSKNGGEIVSADAF